MEYPISKQDQFNELIKQVRPMDQPREFRVGFSLGRFTNMDFIIEPDDEGYVQIGVKQSLRVEKLLRDVFGIND